MGTFQELWSQTSGLSPKEKGDRFEYLSKWFLENDAVYRRFFLNVFHWRDWPKRWSDADNGIDLVAEAHDGTVWAIQCKGYGPSTDVTKSDVNSFIAEATRKQITHLLLLTTKESISPKVRKLLEETEKPASWLVGDDFHKRKIDWPSSFLNLHPIQNVPKQLRPHQTKAVDQIVSALTVAPLGTATMACGTGKTFTSLKVAERLGSQVTLVLVPSIWLVSQTLQEWAQSWQGEIDFLAVCSDVSAAQDANKEVSVNEVGIPVTTKTEDLVSFLQTKRARPKAVFSTYHSSSNVREAAEAIDGFSFDLVIADEAHRTATVSGNYFSEIHEKLGKFAKKRLFMTATPRIAGTSVKASLSVRQKTFYSMDDPRYFGQIVHNLSFSSAISQGLLVDYKPQITCVSEHLLRSAMMQRALVKTDDGVDLTGDELLGMIGLARAIDQEKLTRVITFHSRVKSAERFARHFQRVAEWAFPASSRLKRIQTTAVSASTPPTERRRRLQILAHEDAGQVAVVSNARVLTEGVDIPSVDGVAFIDPKNSIIDIVQAVGRALRLSHNKNLGHIIAVGPLDPDIPVEDQLDDNRLRRVWQVMLALKSHDDRLSERLDAIRTQLGRAGGTRVVDTGVTIDVPMDISAESLNAIHLRLVEETTEAWLFKYGLLKRFFDENGHARVPTTPTFKFMGVHLGTWVSSQRSAYKIGAISEDRINLLSDIPGWYWEVADAVWAEKLDSFKDWLAQGNPVQGPYPHTPWGEITNIYQWVQDMRDGQAYFEAWRLLELESIDGWLWHEDAATLREQREQDRWDEFVFFITRFVEREGHCEIPVEHLEDDFPLGSRASELRKKGKESLPNDRVVELEKLGWPWDLRSDEAIWNRWFELLLEYGQEFGDHNVPRSKKFKKRKLGQWCQSQRDARDSLKDEQYTKLDLLHGWQWTKLSLDEIWDLKFSELKKFVDENGHCSVPGKYRPRIKIDGSVRTLMLAAWMNTQRIRKREQKLETTKIRKLQAIPCWTWDPAIEN